MCDKIVVTGGAGFIGSNLTEALVNNGYKVTVIDNLSFGDLNNLSTAKNTRFVKVGIQNKRVIDKEFAHARCVFHQAALRSIGPSFKNPKKYNQINIEGTLNVLDAARKNDVEKVIFASSSSVYGKQDKLPLEECMKPNPLSPYALTKLGGEIYCKIFYEKYGLDTLSLRYFNVFGPNQGIKPGYTAVIPLFIKAMLSNTQPIVYGDGSQSRDFTYVKNVVLANMLALDSKKTRGEIINISGGREITINTLLKNLSRLLNKDIEIKYVSSRIGEVKRTLADLSRARRLLGYEPKYSFEEGLYATIKYFNNRASAGKFKVSCG